MKATIDATGCLVIPQEIRQQAGIEPGTVVDIRCTDGRIEIEPAALPVTLVRQGRFLVAVPEGEVPPLTARSVEKILRRLRDEHRR